MDIDVKDGRLVRWVKLISSLVLIVAAFFVISFAFTVVRESPEIESKSSTFTRSNGLESEYRYDCEQFKCTPLDDYVWRNNDAYEYDEIINYGSLTGRRQVKTYILNMTSQHWLTEGTVFSTLTRIGSERAETVNYWRTLPRTIHPSHSKSCLVYIDDGWNNPGGNPFPEESIIVKGSQQLALSTGSCVGEQF